MHTRLFVKRLENIAKPRPWKSETKSEGTIWTFTRRFTIRHWANELNISLNIPLKILNYVQCRGVK